MVHSRKRSSSAKRSRASSRRHGGASNKPVCKSGTTSCMKYFDIAFGRRVPYKLTDKDGKIIFDVDRSQKELGVSYLSVLKVLDSILFSFIGLSPSTVGAHTVVMTFKTKLLNVLYRKGRMSMKDTEKIEERMKELDDATGNVYSKRINGLFTKTSTMASDHKRATQFFTEVSKGKYDAVLEKKCERYSLSFINVLIQYLKKYIDRSDEEGVKALFDRFVFEYEGDCKKTTKFKVLVYFNRNFKTPGFVFDLFNSCVKSPEDNPMACAAKEFLNKEKEFKSK